MADEGNGLEIVARDPAGFADVQMRAIRAPVENLIRLLAAAEFVASVGVSNAEGERAAAAVVAGFEQLEQWATAELPQLAQRARDALAVIRSVS